MEFLKNIKNSLHICVGYKLTKNQLFNTCGLCTGTLSMGYGTKSLFKKRQRMLYVFILTLSTMEVSKFNRMKRWHVAFRQKKIETRYLLSVQRYSS